MKALKIIIVLIATLTFSTACEKDKSKEEVVQQPPAQVIIDVSNSDDLSRALDIRGAQRQAGSIPQHRQFQLTQSRVDNKYNLIFGNQGKELKLYLEYSAGILNHSYDGCLLQVVGASEHFKIPGDGQIDQIIIPIQLPENLTEGSFQLKYMAYDTQGKFSNPQTVSVQVGMLNSAPGQIHITPTSDTPNTLRDDTPVDIPLGSINTLILRNDTPTGIPRGKRNSNDLRTDLEKDIPHK